MPGHHHVALRVTDMERGLAFYTDAFAAKTVVEPFVIEGEFAEVVMDGPPGVRWRTAIITIDGGALELFEFDTPSHPISPVHPAAGNLIHFAIQVDDVGAALARVEAAGGHRHWPDIVDLAPGAQVVYVLDPDHNIIELLNVDTTELAALLNHATPGASVAQATATGEKA